MAKEEEIIKQVRLRGKISTDGKYWTEPKPDNLGIGDIKLTLFKSGRKSYFVKFEPVIYDTPPGPGSPPNSTGRNRAYDISASSYDFEPKPSNEKFKTTDDFITSFVENLNISTKFPGDWSNPTWDYTTGQFAKYYSGLTQSGLPPFYEIVQETFDAAVIPSHPEGYFDIWNKWVEDNLKPKPEPITTTIIEPVIIDSKLKGDFKFNVEKKDTFVMVGSTSGSYSVAGDLKIITEPADWVFDNSINPDDELDGEYIEANVVIDGEEDPVLTEIVNPDAALQMMEQRDAEEHQSTETGGTNVQMPGGGSMTGRVNTTYEVNGPSWGKVKKGMDNASLLRAMVSYIEGGYYYPGHAYSKFSAKDRNLYGSSGETLWGIDRHAGQTEATSEGKLFWAEVDKLSGYGNTTGKSGYARKTATRDWNSSSYPTKSSGWSYNYSPKPGSTGYDIMYSSFVKYATSHLESYLNTYFKSHPVKSLILSDSRLKFLWFRSTWNGIGWFSWYATGKKKKGINGLMWAYDNVTKNPDELIIWDLNNRLKFNNGLITHDVKKMAALLGIKPGGGLA